MEFQEYRRLPRDDQEGRALNFEELPIFDSSSQEMRKIVREELDEIVNQAEMHSMFSGIACGFLAVAVMIAIGATVIFGFDCWHFYYPIANYMPVTTMPWSAAGAVSSAVGTMILIANTLQKGY